MFNHIGATRQQVSEMYCGVVYENTALLHHLHHMTQAQRVVQLQAHAGEHDFQQVLDSLEELA
jgi:hypothetical protein